MKLPFTINLGAVKGVLARLKPGKLNPGKLLARVKGVLGGKKKAGKGALGEADLRPSSADDDDMFADLGDLDQLDTDAKARERGEDVDYSADAYATDSQEDLNDLTAGGAVPDEAPDGFADLDAEDAAEEVNLDNLGDMPDFDFEGDEDEDEAADTAAKKKKLLLLAGGGVAAAVLIGAASWLVMSGGDSAAPAAPEVVDMSGHAAVVSLDNIPMTGEEPSGAALPALRHAGANDTTAPQGGLAPPQGDALTLQDDPAHAGLSEGDRTLAQLGLNVAQEPGVGVVVPSVTKASYVGISAAAPGQPLAVAPVDILVEQTDMGLLPRIAEDGRTAFTAYARPEPLMDAAKPKIAVIVTGLGLSRAATEAAIAAMPQDVTLSLDIYARGLDFWVARAREDGHELLLSVPLESNTFPFDDPGPEALQVLDGPEENVQKLHYILSRTTGYFGILADHGGKFLTVEDQVDALVGELKARGLMYVDGGARGSLGTRAAYKMNVPWAAIEVNLDQAQGRAAFDLQLQALIELAQKRSITIARVSATPLSMKQLGAWLATLDQKGFQLVPVSALAKKQLIR